MIARVHCLVLTAVCVCSFIGARISAQSAGQDYALEFDGVTDSVVLPATATMMGPGWEDEKTVSLWVKPEGASRQYPDVAHGDVIFGDQPRWWGISRGIVGGSDKIWIWNYGQGLNSIGIDYTVGEWVHLALVHKDGVLHAYRNGIEIGSVQSGSTRQPETGALPVLHLGGIIKSSTGDWTFEGQIDEVAIWRRGRTGAQIAREVYNSLSGGETDLVAYYRMSDGEGSSLTDDSSNGWAGTLTDGGPGVSPDGQLAQWIPSTVPLADPNAPRVSHYFPQFADGTAGTLEFESSLVLTNTGTQTAWITLQFFRTPNGAPMTLDLGDLGVDSSFEFGLRSGEMTCMTTPGTGDLQVGYARLLAVESVGSVAIFERLDASSGLSMYEAGVPAATLLTDFSIVVDSRGSRDTGLAIVNPLVGSPPHPDSHLRIRLYDQQFNLLAETTVSLKAGSHFSRYVYQLFEDPAVQEAAREMQGTLVVHSDRPLAAVTVREKDTPGKDFPMDVPVLTTFPVIPGAADQP